jgi:hypothetical protein
MNGIKLAAMNCDFKLSGNNLNSNRCYHQSVRIELAFPEQTLTISFEIWNEI